MLFRTKLYGRLKCIGSRLTANEIFGAYRGRRSPLVADMSRE